MKARLCPNGNRDRLRKTVQKDSAIPQFDIIHLLLSLATIFFFDLGYIDIKCAHLQSGPIRRIIYVRPPRELNLPRNILCKLRKLPYGINEAGRQLAKEIESWLVSEYRFQCFFGVSQLHIKRDSDSKIILIATKVTDDILIAGKIPGLTHFTKAISKRYAVRKSIIDEEIQFNGCLISQEDYGNADMDMSEFLIKVKPMVIEKCRQKQG